MSTPPEPKPAFLTPAMRGVLVVVCGIVLVGLFVAVWLSVRPAAQGIRDVAATPLAAAPTQGPTPGATPTTGSEVLPPEASPEIRLPSLSPTTPLLTGPLPASASKENGLVDGFPVDIMGPMPGSDVLDSSVAVEGERMQSTLTGRTDASSAEVEAHYASAWAGLGLNGAAGETADGLSYTGPYESLTLAFSPDSGTGTVYVVYGVLRTS